MPNGVKNNRKANLLVTQKSPYLLQHAYNPVEWHPWGKQALDLAREKDKPILLSIGYSSCHWCHVMETEVFEDNEAAEAINRAFVSIKVDREERPDLDGIYMTVAQMLNGSGGWPLNIIMTPDKEPFFAGTYIPKLTTHGRIGMIDLSKRITDMWSSDRAELVKAGSEITKALIEGATTGSAIRSNNEDFNSAIKGSLQGAYIDLSTRFDEENGGFGHAPKFPTPQTIQFMLRYWRRFDNARALQMAEETMTAMRSGGIFDHLGFGFHRYSTDARWLVPHFEKMLYDQALISSASIELFLATGKAEYRKITEEVFTYVLRDLSGAQGGFHCGEDADSEGVEGKFYTWSEHEIDTALDTAQGAFIKETFNIKASGNFQDESTGMKTGANILHTRGPELSEKSKQDLSSARAKLLLTRDKRVRPMKDDKVLCDWNALMISALARGAGTFDNDLYLQGAERSADFILSNMRLPSGRLLHRYRQGESAIDGFADDYVFLITALIDLYEVTFNVSYLERALEFQDILIEDFWDHDDGGFFFTSKANTDVLVRQKNFYDGAVPSANSMAILNMVKLARMTGRMDLETKANRLAELFLPMSATSGPAYANFLISADFLLGPSFEVVIAGGSDAVDTARLLRALSKEFLPNTVLLFRPTDTDALPIGDISPFTKGLLALDGRATAYVCKDQTCLKPTIDIEEMLEYLRLDDKMDL